MLKQGVLPGVVQGLLSDRLRFPTLSELDVTQPRSCTIPINLTLDSAETSAREVEETMRAALEELLDFLDALFVAQPLPG
jgi:hypothetical protein